MHAKRRHCYLLSFLFLFMATATWAQDPDAAPPQGQDQGTLPAEGGRPGRSGRMGGRGTIGRITALSSNTMEISKPDGTNVAVKLSDSTEFRKDREPAKLSDFKVGDFVMVRGPENPDHSVNAQMIGGRSGNGPRGGEGRFGGGQGRGGGGPGGGAALGELGKDYVVGEVKSIDPPKLTVLRTDNVTQTVELNEETSLRKGRDSITMADIHPGDHVMIRGASQNNVFAPKNAMVMSPEQWERMQQMRKERTGQGTTEPANPSANPAANPPANSAPQR
jgi:hypothetical protein